jgi:hypothetical protein
MPIVFRLPTAPGIKWSYEPRTGDLELSGRMSRRIPWYLLIDPSFLSSTLGVDEHTSAYELQSYVVSSQWDCWSLRLKVVFRETTSPKL